MEIDPAHVVCGWIGNSEAVALKHYLQVTDAHFEKAVFSTSTMPVAQNIGEPEGIETIACDDTIEETQSFSASSIDIRDDSCEENNPTRARTWNDRTKICCVTITPSGYGFL